jgi:phenylacetate-CoA ligase
MGLDPSTLTIEKITCAGECGASIPSTKQRLQEAWGAKVYDHAGATEIGAWSYECMDQPGGMHANEALFLVEIEDLETGEIIEEPGQRGKMIITAFDRLAQPCVRFDSKDVIEWAAEPCSCGRTTRWTKGGIVGRTDDIAKVKGVLLAPSAVEGVVRGVEGLGNEYEVIVDKVDDADEIKLRVEILPEAQHQCQRIETKLADQLRLKTNLRYKIEMCGYETLPRYEIKAKRFKDLRKKECD